MIVPKAKKNDSKTKAPKAETKTENPTELFYYNTKGLEANGTFQKEDKTFIIKGGSGIAKECTPSTSDKDKLKRESLIKSVKNNPTESAYVVLEDIEFASPSGAAHFVDGGSSNGWNVWKNKDGKTLDEIYRQKK